MQEDENSTDSSSTGGGVGERDTKITFASKPVVLGESEGGISSSGDVAREDDGILFTLLYCIPNIP